MYRHPTRAYSTESTAYLYRWILSPNEPTTDHGIPTHGVWNTPARYKRGDPKIPRRVLQPAMRTARMGPAKGLQRPAQTTAMRAAWVVMKIAGSQDPRTHGI